MTRHLARATRTRASSRSTREFTVRLPSLRRAHGRAGDFFMIAQWFPKLARLEPDGRCASFPYHGLGEFYADFADYELTVDVPGDFVIAAPGGLVERRALPGGARRERYRLRTRARHRVGGEPALRRVELRARRRRASTCSRRRAARARPRAGRAPAAHGLGSSAARLGPYPHARLVLVLPPARAQGAAGMEYPGLITGWAATGTSRVNPVARALHDVVTAHELAHQWFPMLVATNEAEPPVLDEGLAEWLGLDLMRERLDGRSSPLSALLGVPDRPVRGQARPSPRPPRRLLRCCRRIGYAPRELAPAVYLRPALALETIARTWGRERLCCRARPLCARASLRAPALARPAPRVRSRATGPASRRACSPRARGRRPTGTRLAVRGSPALVLHAEHARCAPAAVAAASSSIHARGARTRAPVARGPRALVLMPAQPLRGASIDPDRRNLLDPTRRRPACASRTTLRSPRCSPRLLLLAQALARGARAMTAGARVRRALGVTAVAYAFRTACALLLSWPALADLYRLLQRRTPTARSSARPTPALMLELAAQSSGRYLAWAASCLRALPAARTARLARAGCTRCTRRQSVAESLPPRCAATSAALLLGGVALLASAARSPAPCSRCSRRSLRCCPRANAAERVVIAARCLGRPRALLRSPPRTTWRAPRSPSRRLGARAAPGVARLLGRPPARHALLAARGGAAPCSPRPSRARCPGWPSRCSCPANRPSCSWPRCCASVWLAIAVDRIDAPDLTGPKRIPQTTRERSEPRGRVGPDELCSAGGRVA